MQERKWRPAPAELAGMFRDLAALLPGAELRSMFGYPCCFINGQMFTGVHQENIIVRLSEDDRQALLAIPGAAQFEPMAGRPMREYITVPPAMLSDPAALQVWLDKALAYARSLPPKAAGTRSTKTGKKAGRDAH